MKARPATLRALAGWIPNPLRRRLTIELHRSRLGRRMGRDAPFVSAVIAATETQAQFLSECVESIRAQTWGAYEVILVPYAAGDDLRRVIAGLSDDWRWQIVSAAETYGAALNTGAGRARGDYLTFIGGSDTLPPDSFERLVDTLAASGSDFAVGNYVDAAPVKYLLRSDHDRVHRSDRIGIGFGAVPEVLSDTFESNRMFRRRFWSGSGLAFPERTEGPIELPMERAYLLARRFDLLRATTYRRTKRGDGVPFGSLRPVAPGLHEWRTQQRRQLAELEDHGDGELLDAWLYAMLDIGVQPYLGDAERYSDQDWAVIRDAAAELWAHAADRVRRRVRPESRVAVWLAAQDRRPELEDYAARRWFEQGEYATEVRDGVAYAQLPYAGDDATGVPDSCYVLTEHETRPAVRVQRINWQADTLRIDLFCFIANVSMRDADPDVSVSLVHGEKSQPLQVAVEADPMVTRNAGHRYQNYDHGLVTATVSVEQLAALTRGSWQLSVTITASGITRTSAATQLGWQGSSAALRGHHGPDVAVSPRWEDDAGLILEIGDPHPVAGASTADVLIENVVLDDTTVDVYGRWHAAPPDDDWTLSLESGEVTLIGTPVFADEAQWHLRFAATHDPWALGVRAAPPGAYHLRCRGVGREYAVDFADPLLDRLPYDVVGSTYRMRPRRSPHGRPVIELAVPLGSDEQGPYAQEQLQRVYAAARHIDESAAYFQSYVGRSATDSPLAIYYVLQERRPDIKVYWGVVDHSQWVPDGAEPVLMRSRRWYDTLASAKYVVSNIDFDDWFVRRSGQRVLQTYHGCPSKSMGLPLWREKEFTPRRIEQQLARTTYVWDALLSPTPEMDRYYRECFDYEGTILDKGYPRDDVLVSPQAAAIRTATRERLGVGERIAVLYAPTWRDDVATGYRAAPLIAPFDIDEASAQLGDDYVMLLRGHRFHSTEPGRRGNVIDVTSYPEINDLILASDAAVLDYSSLRFDYGVTEKPMIFCVPDLDDYTGGVRGFLYEFRDTAPGPLVDDTEGVVERLRRLDEVGRDHAEAYRRFNDTYNAWQDGHSAQRVVDAFFG